MKIKCSLYDPPDKCEVETMANRRILNKNIAVKKKKRRKKEKTIARKREEEKRTRS